MTETRSDAGLDLDGDRLREECGVFGIFGHADAAAITALGLPALQPRGKEAAGIVFFDGRRFHSERRLGLVGDNFSRREVIERLPGVSAMGHVRYSTTGETILRNVQPLFAELDGGPILASETCALDIIGAKYVRDVENGEVVVFDEEGMHSHKPFPPMAPRPCIFEYIYFSRPDSVVGGRNVYDVRKTMGAQLAREAPADADVVIPVPDSGVPAAIGYAQQSGIPYELGIIRNHYVGRTFIEPSQHIRQLGVRLKHSANRAVVNGKRIVLIDDSIVRGTTSVKIVQMMRDAGAEEVHFRIASPPITHSDYYGIDTPERDKLLAATHDLEGMRQFIGADSLAFLSVEGIYRAMGYAQRDPVRPQYTDHCFTGDYPTALTDLSATDSSPRQLSLLAEAS